MRKHSNLFLTVLTAVFFSCSSKTDKDYLFQLLYSSHTGIEFNNKIDITDDFNVLDFDYIYNGGGVAIGDFNGDGLQDIFFTGNMVSSKLYLNQGNFKFKDVTEKAKVTTNTWAEGVTLVDINNDGLLDIYVSVSNREDSFPNPNLLFVNRGNDQNGTPIFEEMAASFGINDRGYNTQAAFFDYDGDGDLDLYILSNARESFQRNLSRPRDKSGTGKSNDKLFRNNGNGTFTNVSQEAGILIEGYGLGLAISDINQDGLPDIYVANDFLTNDVLYINNGDGTFTNKIAEMIDHQSFNAMGVDIADYNNDRLSDIIVLDMFPPDNLRQKTMFAPTENYDLYQANLALGYEPQYVRNTLQLNRGNNQFSEIGYLAGIFQTDWSWAPLFADFDNDGWRDLFISNGYGKDVTDMDYINFSKNLGPFTSPEDRRKLQLEGLSKLKEVKLPNYVFQNKKDLRFEDKSSAWGLVQASISNGVAYADLDNDGDLDLVINNLNDKAFVYKNNTREKKPQESNFIKIRLQGPKNNLQGLGTKIFIDFEQAGQGQKLYYEHYPTRGYKSFVEPNAHFGLGESQKIENIEIIWPDGKYQVLHEIAPNQTVEIFYENAKKRENASYEPDGIAYYREISEELGIDYRHIHSSYKDFNRQRLLPHKHSENGPGIAVGDINGDGLDDFFVGGSKGNPGTFFIQNTNGKFSKSELDSDYPYDDMGCLLLDIDNDGDLDLYVVSGGTRYEAGSPHYQDRVYINDGKGKFEIRDGIIPQINFSGSVVTAADFDGDGLIDIFIGGRVVPGQYPKTPPSLILKNAGGKFTDVTQEVCPILSTIGMVTDAIWTDFDRDGKVDLIIAGEWMPIKFFRQNVNGDKITFEDVSEEFGPGQSSGWWNSIYATDMDGDGESEYILGNLGLNARWNANPDKPLKLIAKDFDNNQSIDPIMFQYLGNAYYAVPGRDALVSQIPSWKNRFLIYSAYAGYSLENFFNKTDLENAVSLEAQTFASGFLKKNREGKFEITPLPIEAQIGPIYGILQNGNEILMTGNFFGNETITGRYNGLKGVHFTSEKGRLKPNSLRSSGFLVTGQGRGLALLTHFDGKKLILAVQHDGKLKVFTKNQPEKEQLTIPLDPLDFKLIITLKDGSQRQYEVFHNNGYLSQSSRRISIKPDYGKIEAIDFSGNKRILWKNLSE
ncbi:VCBS repeat-containing protein [Cecembia calidifontis]|uniref:VCBS repeat protein n=1 Tax=Cecembia calidifontis TaxID=1187080 RepID=A0A4Q7P8S7_9BACT|nr:VCBS repeat-containing protein [Cecembia calidifontis]RZS96531.1 VCBS repeat protein [Cecembia calidifontis]